MQRVTVEMKPVSTPYLQLTFGVNPDLGLTPETVCAKVGRIAELVRGSGFGYDLLNEPAPGQMAVQFLPTSAEAILRLTWLQEKLPPVIADIREVTGPEWTVIPAA